MPKTTSDIVCNVAVSTLEAVTDQIAARRLTQRQHRKVREIYDALGVALDRAVGSKLDLQEMIGDKDETDEG